MTWERFWIEKGEAIKFLDNWTSKQWVFWSIGLLWWNSSWKENLWSEVFSNVFWYMCSQLATPLSSICGTIGKFNFCCSTSMLVVFWCSLNEYSSATCNMLASCKCLSDFADFSAKIWLAPLPCISCAVHTSNPELIHCFKNYSCLQSPTVVLNFTTKKNCI